MNDVECRRQLKEVQVRENAQSGKRGVDVQTRSKAGTYDNGQKVVFLQVGKGKQGLLQQKRRAAVKKAAQLC